jgi:hypothetical protein
VAVNTIWAMGCVAKFLWPLPDRGLSKRLHRVSAPTLVICEDDALIPVHYAQEFGHDPGQPSGGSRTAATFPSGTSRGDGGLGEGVLGWLNPD